MKYGDLTLQARLVTLHHSDMGKSNRERKLSISPLVIRDQKSDVLGTCKSFSFTLIASLNRYMGVCWSGGGVGGKVN